MRHLRSQIISKLQALPRDASGNILPLAAAGMLVAAAVVGSAIDFSREYKVQNQLQSACDAAVLAGRRTVTTNGFDTASQTVANNYFATNFDDSGQETTGTTFTANSTDGGQTVNGSASTTLNTLIMRLFGFNTFNVRAQCASSMGVGNADVMMVLDTTGSMDSTLSGSQTRIQALRAAMKNFYTTLATATGSSNARIRYGFVPYSSTVNVGNLLYTLNPTYLADSWNYQSRQPIFVKSGNSSTSTNTVSTGNTTTTASSCSTSSSFSNSGTATVTYSTSGTSPNITSTTTTTQPQSKITGCSYSSRNRTYTVTAANQNVITTVTYTSSTTTPTSGYSFDHWEYKQIARDTSTFKTFAKTATYTGDSGASVSSTWDGCIEERATTTDTAFSYSSTAGYSPSGAKDIDIDAAPTSTSTKWGPQWYQISYTRGTGTGSTANWTQSTTSDGSAVKEYCPVKAQLLTQMTQTSFNSYADSLVANGGTYLDIGMIWGGRLASPNGIFSSNVNSAPSNGGEVSRHIIFMTDGEMDTSNYSTSAWGLDWWDRRVSTDGAEATADARHYSRFLAVCDAIKAKGIRIWVIAFTSDLSTQLQTCASDGSSYTAGDADELNTAFQEIAKQVGELRVTL